MARQLSEIQAEIWKATQDWTAAKNDEDMARTKKTSALNDLNKLQKEFDAAVEELKKTTPQETDWHRAERQRKAVAA